MGSDDLFKKRREGRRRRKYEYKKPRANSFLIVTEGKCTEPLYFQGIQKLIEANIGGVVDIVPTINISGEGCSTGKLLETTEQIVKDATIIYQNVWIVFDKDDFEDFDQAIREGTRKGYKMAWSNQSFEYWIYLHFFYGDSALHREDWINKLDEIFEQYKLGKGKYQKNYEDIYNMVNQYGSVSFAVKNAKRRMKGYDGKKCKPSEYDPGTMVYKLVEELIQFIVE